MGESTFWSLVGGGIGGFLGGPQGAAEGAMLGAVAGNWLPGPADISKKLAGDIAKKGVTEAGRQAWSNLSGERRELLGCDLEKAFEDAYLNAVYD